MNARLPKKMSRRKFLSGSAKLALGVTGVLAGSGGLFYYGAVRGGNGTRRELPVGMISLGDPGRLSNVQGVQRIGYEGIVRDAWAEKPVNGFVYATKDAGGGLLLMSPACTHLGCTIEPLPEKERGGPGGRYFRCPCHGAEYDSKGNCVKLSLPNLDTYEPRLIDGNVYINVLKPIKSESL